MQRLYIDKFTLPFGYKNWISLPFLVNLMHRRPGWASLHCVISRFIIGFVECNFSISNLHNMKIIGIFVMKIFGTKKIGAENESIQVRNGC